MKEFGSKKKHDTNNILKGISEGVRSEQSEYGDIVNLILDDKVFVGSALKDDFLKLLGELWMTEQWFLSLLNYEGKGVEFEKSDLEKYNKMKKFLDDNFKKFIEEIEKDAMENEGTSAQKKNVQKQNVIVASFMQLMQQIRDFISWLKQAIVAGIKQLKDGLSESREEFADYVDEKMRNLKSASNVSVDDFNASVDEVGNVARKVKFAVRNFVEEQIGRQHFDPKVDPHSEVSLKTAGEFLTKLESKYGKDLDKNEELQILDKIRKYLETKEKEIKYPKKDLLACLSRIENDYKSWLNPKLGDIPNKENMTILHTLCLVWKAAGDQEAFDQMAKEAGVEINLSRSPQDIEKEKDARYRTIFEQLYHCQTGGSGGNPICDTGHQARIVATFQDQHPDCKTYDKELGDLDPTTISDSEIHESLEARVSNAVFEYYDGLDMGARKEFYQAIQAALDYDTNEDQDETISKCKEEVLKKLSPEDDKKESNWLNDKKTMKSWVEGMIYLDFTLRNQVEQSALDYYNRLEENAKKVLSYAIQQLGSGSNKISQEQAESIEKCKKYVLANLPKELKESSKFTDEEKIKTESRVKNWLDNGTKWFHLELPSNYEPEEEKKSIVLK